MLFQEDVMVKKKASLFEKVKYHWMENDNYWDVKSNHAFHITISLNNTPNFRKTEKETKYSYPYP